MPRVRKLSLRDIRKEDRNEYLKFKESFSGFENQISI